jgi:hypothetical protein
VRWEEEAVPIEMPHPDGSTMEVAACVVLLLLFLGGVVWEMFRRGPTPAPSDDQESDWEDGFDDEDSHYWDTAPLHDRLATAAVMVDSTFISDLLIEAAAAIAPEVET